MIRAFLFPSQDPQVSLQCIIPVQCTKSEVCTYDYAYPLSPTPRRASNSGLHLATRREVGEVDGGDHKKRKKKNMGVGISQHDTVNTGWTVSKVSGSQRVTE